VLHEADHEFYDRAQEHLRIANEQLDDVSRGQVSASMMYACARFNAWLSASDRQSATDLKSAYGETIEYFVAQYRKMLVKNLDEFVANFGEYRQPPADTKS
jgi:PPE-repeat protein